MNMNSTIIKIKSSPLPVGVGSVQGALGDCLSMRSQGQDQGLSFPAF